MVFNMIDGSSLQIFIVFIAFQILVSSLYFFKKNNDQKGLKYYVVFAFFGWLQFNSYVFINYYDQFLAILSNNLLYIVSYYFLIRAFIIQLNIQSYKKVEILWFVLAFFTKVVLAITIENPVIRIPIGQLITAIIPLCYLLILLFMHSKTNEKPKEINFVAYTFILILLGNIAYVYFGIFSSSNSVEDNNFMNYSLLIMILGHLSTVVAMLMTISGQKEVKLLKLANTDSLTGLPTNRVATDRLNMAINIAKRDKSRVALLYLDLDGFKAVNDTLGHDAGDEVLKTVSTRILSAVRCSDTACRIGGDEFLIILPSIKTLSCIEDTCTRLIDIVGEKVHYNNQDLIVGVSIGVALFPDHANDITSLRIKADETMYIVKQEGKNNFKIATDNFIN